MQLFLLFILVVFSNIVFFTVLFYVVKNAVKNGIMEADWAIRNTIVEAMKSYNRSSDEENKASDRIAKTTCRSCGIDYDIDYPKCPWCKHDYNSSPT